MGGTTATYPYSWPAARSLLPFPPADLGGEQEGKRAALGTDGPARKEWPARPFPVLRGFSRELLLSMWEQEAAGKQIPSPPVQSLVLTSMSQSQELKHLWL